MLRNDTMKITPPQTSVNGVYYTSKENPFGKARVFIALGKLGRYPLFQIGRRYLALRSDVDGFIQSNPVTVPDEPLSEADQFRLELGLRPRGRAA